MDVRGRLHLVRAELQSQGLEGLLVTKSVNVRWLTGFTGSNGQLAITANEFVLITDGRYREQAANELTSSGVDARVEIAVGSGSDLLVEVFHDVTSVGFEAADMTVDRHRRLVTELTTIELVATESLIELLRQVKDDGEIERLTRASAIADAGFRSIQNLVHDRPTERRLGAELDHRMRLVGADDVSFETIVGSGPNGALPHARPSQRAIEHGDLVVLDFGAKVDGYGSDMTRTVVAGGKPTDKQRHLYDAVFEAQQAGVNAIVAGVEQIVVDRACREVLAKHGLAEAYTHGTGHGIGLEIHEQPILSTRSLGILRAGQVVTVEPGAYLPGFGGVRVEDSVVVTEKGCVSITRSPKGLVPDFRELERP
jgi:Xaa-Pro aminopeptidase